MATFIACKLPHGLTIRHEGEIINLNGPAETSDPMNPSANGVFNDGEKVSGGFGLTELNDTQTAVYDRWADAVTYKVKDGKSAKANGKLDEPFLPLQNGSIMKFGSEDEARAETRSMSGMVTSGFEGLDTSDLPDGVQTADNGNKAAPKGKSRYGRRQRQ